MNQILSFVVFAGGLMLSMLAVLEFGRRIGVKHRAQDPEGASVGYRAMEGAVFALMGLLIAFTFSTAAAHFDARRKMIVEEANCIGTAYLRIDLLPDNAQPALRDLFRRYLEVRLNTFRAIPDMASVRAQIALSTDLRKQIWEQVVAAVSTSSRPAGALQAQALASLNQMFDIATMRNMTAQMHTPFIVFAMLALLSVAGSFFAGYDMSVCKLHHWMHTLCFVGIFAISIYFILDFEYPRLGLIRLEAFDQPLTELQQGMR